MEDKSFFCFKCGKQLIKKSIAQYHPKTGEPIYYYGCESFKIDERGSTNYHMGYYNELTGEAEESLFLNQGFNS